MKTTTLKSRQSWINKGILSLIIAVGLVSTSFAAQFDAPYYEFKKQHGAEWAKEDKAIDAKLAALENKFGKKPNIVYILTDDIGHGELGVQGGGASRGAPTPQLDRMAHEGVMLNGFYSALERQLRIWTNGGRWKAGARFQY